MTDNPPNDRRNEEDTNSGVAPNRRRFLQAVTASATVGLGAGIASSAAADDGPDIGVEEVDGDKAKRLIGIASDSDEFEKLAGALDDKVGATIDDSEASVVEVSKSGTDYNLVTFYPESEQGIDLTIALEQSDVVNAKAVVVEDESDRVIDFSLEGDEVVITNSEDIFIAQDCGLCGDLVEAACNLGCSVGASAICTAAGVGSGGIGGVACSIAANAVCNVIAEIGCDPGADVICSQAGYC